MHRNSSINSCLVHISYENSSFAARTLVPPSATAKCGIGRSIRLYRVYPMVMMMGGEPFVLRGRAGPRLEILAQGTSHSNHPMFLRNRLCLRS